MSISANYGSTGKASGLKGTGYNQVSIPTLSPEQMGLFQQLLGGSQKGLGGSGGGLDFLSRIAGGDQSQFEQLEAPALRQFGELQGQLASRFSGMGSGARRSSGFQNATSGAAADLAERLQSQRLGLQQSAIQQLLGLSQSLLGRDLNDNFLIPKKKSGWETFLEGLGGVGAQTAGQFGGMGLGKWAGLLG